MANITPLQVQKRLLELGYDVGPDGADGEFGRNTSDALVRFQKNHPPLALTGQPDVPTVAKLFPITPKGTAMQNILVNLLSSSVVLGLIRNGLLAAGTVLVTKGYVDDATLTEIVGWAMGGIGVLLSVLSNAEKAEAKKVVKAVEAHPDITLVPSVDTGTGKPKVLVAPSA